MQRVELDHHGAARFVKNDIIGWLLESGVLDLNALRKKRFSPEDHEQLRQLLGMSVSRFGTLECAQESTVRAADLAAESLHTTIEERGAKFPLPQPLPPVQPPPDRIYLQDWGGMEPTWCDEQINHSDVEYQVVDFTLPVYIP